MREDDAAVFRQIQRTTEMGIRAIETILPKLEENEFSRRLSRQELAYSSLRDQARQELLRGKEEPYRSTALAELFLKGGIHAGTLLNTSQSHVAGLMIQGSTKGLSQIWKTLNHYGNAGSVSTDLASELMDFEQKNIRDLKKYL